MPFGGFHAEPRLEPCEEGFGQRDLRNQDQRLPALPQSFRHGFEIDFGLARARDAVQQGHRKTRLAHGPAEAVGGRLLIARQTDLGMFRIRHERHRSRRNWPLPPVPRRR